MVFVGDINGVHNWKMFDFGDVDSRCLIVSLVLQKLKLYVLRRSYNRTIIQSDMNVENMWFYIQ